MWLHTACTYIARTLVFYAHKAMVNFVRLAEKRVRVKNKCYPASLCLRCDTDIALCAKDSAEMRKDMKKKIEVKTPEDIEKVEKQERAKWEIALELGLFDKVVESGWKSLTARESGRIGGILSSRKMKE